MTNIQESFAGSTSPSLDVARMSEKTLGDRPFEKAYLIHLFQWMIDRGAEFHRVDTPGGYMELDTLEDLELAQDWWEGRS